MTYREAYRYGEARLTEERIDDALLDARLLLEYVCGTDRNALILRGQEEITEEQETRYVNLIERRSSHVPLQYLTGEQEFMGLKFYVNEFVLIPRQDTETLVEEALSRIRDGMRVLDMCTGSGCILLSIMKYRSGIEGAGADISEKALAVAGKNAAFHGMEAQWVRSDLFEKVEGCFDVILSNPPYIPRKALETLPEEVICHEPPGALDGKDDGLYYYRRIAAEAPAYLTEGGWLYFEIGFDQAEAVMRILAENGFEKIGLKQDLAGLDRVVWGCRMKREEDRCSTS